MLGDDRRLHGAPPKPLALDGALDRIAGLGVEAVEPLQRILPRSLS
jgi:hypothetical protein